MSSKFLDVCRFTPTLGGTTDWTYSSAVTGYQSPADAGVVNGAQYSYRAESSDLSQWEVGTGTYNTGTGVLTRATVLTNSSRGTSKITFSAAPQVAIVALAEDLTVTNAAVKSDQQAATSTIVAVTPAHQQDHPSAIKAHCAFTGSSGALQGTAHNITSVSRTGAGQYQVNFTTAFADAHYDVLITVEVAAPFSTSGTWGYVINGGRGTAGVQIATVTAGGASFADAASVFITCNGVQ